MTIPSVSSVVSSQFGWHNDAVNDLAAIEADLTQLVSDYTADNATRAALVSEIASYGLPQPGFALGGENYSEVSVLSDAPISPLPLIPEGDAITVSLCTALIPVMETLGADSALIAALTNASNGTPLAGSLPNPWPPA